MKKIYISLILFFGIIISCDESGDINSLVPSYDNNGVKRQSIMVGWANHHIQKPLQDLKSKLDILDQKVGQANNDGQITSVELIELRKELLNSWNSWQRVAHFNWGKAEESYYSATMNIYPVNTDRVNLKITSRDFDFSNPNDYAAQGFPTIDYLLNGYGSDDGEILNNLNYDDLGGAGPNGLVYLVKIIEEMQNNTQDVLGAWESGGEDNVFKTQTADNTATSPFNMVINDFIFYYEKGFRANKFGIPGGVFSSTPIPENVESYFGGNSKELAITAIEAIYDFYVGNDPITGESYLTSLDDISLQQLIYDLDLNQNNNEGSDNLGSKISLKISEATSLISQLDNNNFADQISNDNTKFLEVYNAIQRVVVLLKVDMLQLLSINVDYIDADGD